MQRGICGILGFRTVEAYTPYPVEGLDQVLRPGAPLFCLF